MAGLHFSLQWLLAGSDQPALRHTSAQLGLYVDDVCLTRNEDVWSRTVRDSVLLSAYPLALWLASSWWRLNWEPLPPLGRQPSHDWRMAHEVGAADHGFVWPRVLFASDGEAISVWAAPTSTQGQSVRYLTGLDGPRSVALADFQQRVRELIQTVINRLDATDCAATDLASLWILLQEDQADPEAQRRRRLEAELGFDPEECPEHVLAAALTWQQRMGMSAFSELAPVFGAEDSNVGLSDIEQLVGADGVVGEPEVSSAQVEPLSNGAPWQRGVHAARQLRVHLGNLSGPVRDKELTGLLGLPAEQVTDWKFSERHPVAVAMPIGNSRGLKFVTRKKHPAARRFEFARFVADRLQQTNGATDWLASTDLATSRQKYQRAFAAEFLCPIEALVDFLRGDYSEAAFEEAADHFRVGEQTVESLLVNNGYIAPPSTYWRQGLPYRFTP